MTTLNQSQPVAKMLNADKTSSYSMSYENHTITCQRKHSGWVAPAILNVNARCGLVMNATPQPFYLTKKTWYPL
jgi:hypothetical protein